MVASGTIFGLCIVDHSHGRVPGVVADLKYGKSYQVHYSKKNQVCPWFAKGKCEWDNRCHYSHEAGDSLVMIVEQQVQAALARMEVKQSQAAG